MKGIVVGFGRVVLVAVLCAFVVRPFKSFAADSAEVAEPVRKLIHDLDNGSDATRDAARAALAKRGHD